MTCVFKGNHFNLIKMVRFLDRLNDNIDDIVLEKKCKMYFSDYLEINFVYSCKYSEKKNLLKGSNAKFYI